VKVTLLTRVLTIKQTWNRILKMTVSCDVAPCSLVADVSELRVAIHHPDDGGSTYFRKDGLIQRDCTAQRPRTF